MELYVIGDGSVNAYSEPPTTLIEDWDTLNWTERYQDVGDFELKTRRVKATMEKIKLGTHLTLSDTREMMTVDEIEIGRDETDDILTIRGSSFESFYKYRAVCVPEDSLSVLNWQRRTDITDKEAALWYAYVGMHGAEMQCYMKNQPSGPPFHEFVANSLGDYMGKRVISTTLFSGLSTKTWEFANTIDAYSGLIDALAEGDLGIRTLRNNYWDQTLPTPAHYRFYWADNSTGVKWTSEPGGNVHGFMMMEIYSGVDRRVSQNNVPAVVLDASRDDITEFRFRRDRRSRITAVCNFHRVGENTYTSPKVSKGTELEVRSAWVENVGPEPGTTRYYQQAAKKGRRMINRNRRQSFIDTELSPKSQFKFGKDFGLGDLVTIRVPVFGIQQGARVSEFVRSMDKGVYTEYPGFGEV